MNDMMFLSDILDTIIIIAMLIIIEISRNIQNAMLVYVILCVVNFTSACLNELH